MFKFPNIVLLPPVYEKKLKMAWEIFLPIIVMFLSFSAGYCAIWNVLSLDIVIDIPAICLFCLFFRSYSWINMPLFFLIASLFEYEFMIAAGQSLVFYGIFAGLLYGGLRWRSSAFPHYLILMTYFLTLYFVALMLYHIGHIVIEYDVMNIAFILKTWFSMMIFYPVLFYIFYVILIKRPQRTSFL